MTARLRSAVVAALIVFGVLAPTAGFAVTVDQVVALAKAGVTDAVILALIDRDRTVFAIEPEQIVKLQRDGLSDAVILAMLKSGREEGERAAQAAADLNTAVIMSSLAPALVIVGHGPETPNVAHPNGFYSGPPGGGYLALPYFDGGRRRSRRQAPIATPFISPFHKAVIPPVTRHVEPPPRALCRAEVNTATSTSSLTFVTECPDVVQPARRR